MKRIEQGNPVEILDLHNCHRYSPPEDWLQSLSEAVVDVLGPGKAFDAMKPFWAVVHDLRQQ